MPLLLPQDANPRFQTQHAYARPLVLAHRNSASTVFLVIDCAPRDAPRNGAVPQSGLSQAYGVRPRLGPVQVRVPP